MMFRDDSAAATAVIWRHAAIGAAFGLCFPLACVIALVASGSVSPASTPLATLSAAHAHSPLLYVIDSAPLFLGLFAGFAGVRQARLLALNASLEAQVAARTASLNDALKRSEKTNVLISHMADHDSLTGLFNRRRAQRELAASVAYARRYGRSFGLVFIDLDRLKLINDRHGHEAGDRYLAGFAALLERTVRETDKLARWGGDEFVVVLPEAGGPEAERFVARLGNCLRSEHIDIGPARITPSASIGVAIYPQDGSEPESLLAKADADMYRVKSAEDKHRVSAPV